MHSETVADHDLSLSHLHRRRDESETAEEGASVDKVIQFEEKHRKSLPDNLGPACHLPVLDGLSYTPGRTGVMS